MRKKEAVGGGIGLNMEWNGAKKNLLTWLTSSI